jgi:hypothetical protein
MLLVGHVFTVIVNILLSRTINFAIIAVLSKATPVVDGTTFPPCLYYICDLMMCRALQLLSKTLYLFYQPCPTLVWLRDSASLSSKFGSLNISILSNKQFPVRHAVNLTTESSHYFNMRRLVPPSNRALTTHMILQWVMMLQL